MTTKRSKHDQIFRKAMENPLVAHEFLNAHLPKHIKALIDFPSLKFENTSFVEQNLRDSISDVLFSAKFDGKDGYLFLLVEHQSSADHFMAFRLLRYMLNICDRYLTLNPKAKSLPLIYPLIFFNGAGDYNASRNLWELFEDNLLAKEIWTNDYQIVNVNDIPDEQLKQRVWSGIFEFFAKHIRERDLLRRWQEIAYMLPELVKVNIGYNYIELLLYYTLTRINKEDKLELEKLLTSKLNQETGTRLMGSLAQHWEQIGEARGEARGEAKLIRMLMRKGRAVKEIATMTGLPISKINELLKIDIQEESPE
ncbi:MAG: Rpn family recombination-promoting nuclease/putative transposase [Rickettsiaceae bacterium]|nr:Rpn family recombination-promoting nuclease/putative transposase [Rickettsiaceae bacterium]MDD9337446.1 Rpn family recombination-promoting nuclease/putative transposase [Rickettsiaceae bacterium]